MYRIVLSVFLLLFCVLLLLTSVLNDDDVDDDTRWSQTVFASFIQNDNNRIDTVRMSDMC